MAKRYGHIGQKGPILALGKAFRQKRALLLRRGGCQCRSERFTPSSTDAETRLAQLARRHNISITKPIHHMVDVSLLLSLPAATC